ncbi:hypothetical protein MESS2_1650025 [Mesorhizobium metallidurans STM 2683]|uniref:Uncharacterized protein n=1 Tax=Mesorhizobium metallidurans STM 2683 TaxID=1297569 RepID=M5EN33_9HYPH|nr:hypothetical protein MESS2_1650025 [Mesorhizobium metallidurans STM 2683]
MRTSHVRTPEYSFSDLLIYAGQVRLGTIYDHLKTLSLRLRLRRG